MQAYKDSNYRFTDPIRLFKANDPYYYEVDNIPLRQLNENCLWLKDQIGGSVSSTAITRSDFDELRPYVDGNSNLVKVRPGRYTARINSVEDLPPLQIIAQVAGFNIGELDVFSVLTSNAAALQATFDKFFTYQASNVLNMNGLAERILSYPTASSDEHIQSFIEGATYNGFRVGKKRPGFPGNEVLTWEKSAEQTSFNMPGYAEEDQTLGYGVLSVLESYFVKKWRGVARTAIVDVPDELSIEIQPFSEDDFFYTNANGQKTKLTGATQRIDLLFIYSKPIDTSAVTIAKYTDTYGQETQGTKITKAQLGILKGAGIGLDIQNKGFPEGTAYPKQGRETSTGNPLMLANPSDELSTTNGFENLNIHGSFPSPEDLLNLSPVLSEYIQNSDLQLIGQSVLPVAYIVVRKNATVNSEGANILTDSDLVDIRPFFRTAELTYSERSGLAAALPSLSLANPAVGKYQLDREIQLVYREVLKDINDLRGRIGGGTEQTPRPIGAGYILGGGYYGVESVLMNYFYENNFARNSTWETVREFTRAQLGFPNNLVIPDFPDWDLANWVRADASIQNPGLYTNDYVDVFYSFDDLLRYSSFGQGLIANPLGTAMMKKFGSDNIDFRENMVAILYCKKKIPIDRSQVQWMQDYHVDAQWMNCTPLTSRAFGENSPAFAAPAGIWVSKEANSFTIHCAWVANDLHPIERVNSKKRLMSGYPFQATPKNNRENHWFAGIAVTHPSMLPVNTRYINGMSEFGAATYPSISFKVTGYPGAWRGYVGRLSTNQAITFV